MEKEEGKLGNGRVLREMELDEFDLSNGNFSLGGTGTTAPIQNLTPDPQLVFVSKSTVKQRALTKDCH